MHLANQWEIVKYREMKFSIEEHSQDLASASETGGLPAKVWAGGGGHYLSDHYPFHLIYGDYYINYMYIAQRIYIINNYIMRSRFLSRAVVQKFNLNPLRHFENTKKRSLAHAYTLLNIYNRIDSGIANQRTAFVIER